VPVDARVRLSQTCQPGDHTELRLYNEFRSQTQRSRATGGSLRIGENHRPSKARIVARSSPPYGAPSVPAPPHCCILRFKRTTGRSAARLSNRAEPRRQGAPSGLPPAAVAAIRHLNSATCAWCFVRHAQTALLKLRTCAVRCCRIGAGVRLCQGRHRG
jgi:hypothetical protein